MRFIRSLLILLGVLAGIAALLLLVALSPVVQTWAFERWLNGFPGIHASAEEVSAGPSGATIANLRVERNGAVLFIPNVDAAFSLKSALLDHKLVIQRVTAKGWTLDLSPHKGTGTTSAKARVGEAVTDRAESAAQAAATPTPAAPGVRVGHLLDGWRLPFNGSVDGLDTEGDVVLAPIESGEPTRLHVQAKGDGLGRGRAADLALDVEGTLVAPPVYVGTASAHGHLRVGVGADAAVRELAFKGTLASDGHSLPAELQVDAGITAPVAAAETYSLDLQRAGRPIVRIHTQAVGGTQRIAGTWLIDATDADVAALLPIRRIQLTGLKGKGGFDSDAAFARVHATGAIRIAARHLDALVPALERVGSLSASAEFDVTHGGGQLSVAQLRVALTGSKPIAELSAAQPFTIDERTGDAKPANPGADWVRGTLQGLPLASLLPPGAGIGFSGGEMVGEFAAGSAAGGWSIRSVAPLSARGVTLQRATAVFARNLDLTLGLSAEYAPGKGWLVRGAPVTVASAGRQLATLDLTVDPAPDAYGRLGVNGTWSADLDACAAQSAVPGLRWVKGRTATGDLSAHLGAATDLVSNLTVVGHDATHTLSGAVAIAVDDFRALTLHLPLKVALGKDVAEVNVDGTSTPVDHADRIDLQVASPKLSLDHLRLLTSAIPFGDALPGGDVGHVAANASGRTSADSSGRKAPPTASESAADGQAARPYPTSPDVAASASERTSRDASGHSARDARPFWGDVIGRVRFDFRQMRVGDRDWTDVGGTLGLAPDALQLNGGRAVYLPQPVANRNQSGPNEVPLEPTTAFTAEGTLSFHADAAAPYALKASGGIDEIDASRLFGWAFNAPSPLIEGHWAVAATVSGAGNNLQDVLRNREEQYRLSSSGGTLRLLKASVAEALPDAATPVSDAVAGVGSAVGTLFGIRRGAAENKVNKQTEAVLNFTYQSAELLYDKFTFVATRLPDGAIHLSDIEITSPNEHLTGSGEITNAKGLPFASRPIRLDLRLAVRGIAAERLATAGLLGADKDPAGYTRLRAPLVFGGTLRQIDRTQWTALLVKAATPAGK